MQDFEDAVSWLRGTKTQKLHLLLGNGFSMAYDRDRFSYAALTAQAEHLSAIPALARQLMAHADTPDFERTMRELETTAFTLEVLDRVRHAALIGDLRQAVTELREALAQSIAGLHPDRPYAIDDEAYLHTRQFLDRFDDVYTTSYDLLLYWAIMQDLLPDHPGKQQDDGFRDSGLAGDDTVLWDIYTPYRQSVHYLHGALHLFQGADGLRKVTWVRTELPLIDQVRAQLAAGRFPLYVAEGTSASKVDRINRSAYLSKALRSLAGCGGGLVIHGHSLDANDDHIFDGVVRSSVERAAISIFGDEASERSRTIMERGTQLAARRLARRPSRPLAVDFYQAESVTLW